MSFFKSMTAIELTTAELEYSEKSSFRNLPQGEYKINDRERLMVGISGMVTFYLDGDVHREKGPACIFPGRASQWRKHGMLHRETGPAFVWVDGKIEFWLNNHRFWSRKEWKRAMDKLRSENNLSESSSYQASFKPISSNI